MLAQYFRLNLILPFFLIFHQISGSFAYKTVLLKKSVRYVNVWMLFLSVMLWC